LAEREIKQLTESNRKQMSFKSGFESTSRERVAVAGASELNERLAN